MIVNLSDWTKFSENTFVSDCSKVEEPQFSVLFFEILPNMT